VDLPETAPTSTSAPRRLGAAQRGMQPRGALVVCLLLSVCATGAMSLYFNVPPIWNPPAPRKADRLYNSRPPITYRLVRADGPLRHAAAWCQALAALLSVAALRGRSRHSGRFKVPRADAARYADPYYPFLRVLLVFHVASWISLVTGRGGAAPAAAALAVTVAWYVGTVSARPALRPTPLRLRVPHVPSLLFLGLALTVGGPRARRPQTDSATVVQDGRGPALAAVYAREWGLLIGAVALLAGLVLGRSPATRGDGPRFSPLTLFAGAVLATVLVAGVGWYRQPLPNFGEAVPGVLYYSGQPGARSLALAQRRHGFRTIVYVHPDTNTAAHAGEARVARRCGIRLIDAIDEGFRPEDLLRLARDPSARPILLHCIEGKNRTPAWLAVYRIAEQGWSARKAFAEMERVSGRRLKSYIIQWVEKTAARLKGPAQVATARMDAE
jgi:hypothetical protein